VIEAGQREGFAYTAEEIAARLEPPAVDVSRRVGRIVSLLQLTIFLTVAFWVLYWLHQWIGFWDVDLNLGGWVYPLNILVPIFMAAFGRTWYSRTRST